MTILAASGSLPGIYPLIIQVNPPQKGVDNIGMGFTQYQEQFLLKEGGCLGAAEFIGSRLCDACGIPACQPAIVSITQMGVQRNVFGSRIESGTHTFNQTDVSEWRAVLANCSNPSAFSALFAIDLVLGNDDRHWNNWLVQTCRNVAGVDCFRLRAMDFSRSWPRCHPPQAPLVHDSRNTWQSAKEWGLLGVTFDPNTFYDTCVKIQALSAHWMRKQVLYEISGVFISPTEVDQYCQWWELNLKTQVIEAIYSLENGVWP